MKPFNLEEALSGKPVKLRNGCKGLIYYKVPAEYSYGKDTPVVYPLLGMFFTEDGYVDIIQANWRLDGQYGTTPDDLDIVGMWDEMTTLIEKAIKEELPVKLRDGSKAIVWNKIPEKYVFSNGKRPAYPFQGAVLEYNDHTVKELYAWTENGTIFAEIPHNKDIVSLWD